MERNRLPLAVVEKLAVAPWQTVLVSRIGRGCVLLHRQRRTLRSAATCAGCSYRHSVIANADRSRIYVDARAIAVERQPSNVHA